MNAQEKDNKVEYAAVLIPTLCRIEHLKRCIESLLNCSLAKHTDLYIGIDYPPEEKYINGWKKVTEYVDNELTGFGNIYVFKHERNLGAEGNALFVLDKAKEKHNRFVFTEDDNEFASDYLEYCNTLLERFENDEDIIAISGFNYPISVSHQYDKVYSNDVYFAAFGFASWFTKFDKMFDELTVEWLRNIYNNRHYMKSLLHRAPNQYCNFVKGMLGYTTPIERNDNIWKSDMVYGVYMYSTGKKMLFPIVSKVRNWGYDGSGDNCDKMDFDCEREITHRNLDVGCQKLDGKANYTFDGFVGEEDNKQLLSAVDAYFNIPIKEVVRTQIAYVVSRIVGVEVIRKMWNK